MKRYKKLDFNTKDLESLSNSDLKKVADYELRQFLLRKAGNNYIFCPIKKKNFPQENMHCCHFYDRGIMSLRYDLKNVHLISAVSNTFDAQVQVEGYKSKHHYEYELYLRSIYGDEVMKYLLDKSKEVVIFYKTDYIKIINEFRNNE